MALDLFAVLRAAHILLAATWLGAAALLTLFLGPAMRRSGRAGGSVMASAVGAGLSRFMAALGGLTLLSGLWLYWLWSQGLNAGVVHSGSGVMLALGALAAITAAAIGGAVLGRSARELAALGDDDAQQARRDALFQRMARFGRIDLGLLVVAMLLMALSRFA